jgi:hypothetical protein
MLGELKELTEWREKTTESVCYQSLCLRTYLQLTMCTAESNAKAAPCGECEERSPHRRFVFSSTVWYGWFVNFSLPDLEKEKKEKERALEKARADFARDKERLGKVSCAIYAASASGVDRARFFPFRSKNPSRQSKKRKSAI